MAHVSSLSQESWQVDCSGQALTGYPVSYLNALSFICHLHRKEQRELVPIWWAGSYWHIISFSNTWTQCSPKAALGLLKSFPSLLLPTCMREDTYLPEQLYALEKSYSEVIFSCLSESVFFWLVKPRSVSVCVIVWLHLCRVTPAMYRVHSGWLGSRSFCLASVSTEGEDNEDWDSFLPTFALSFM